MTDWNQLPDLASRRLGGGVVAANDEFFAERENLIKPTRPEYRPHTFTNKGQEYDGWETRRRRDDGHDWAVVRLGIAGTVHTAIVDTTHFKGNYPPHCAIDGAAVEGYPDTHELLAADWEPLIEKSPLTGDSQNTFSIGGTRRHTHVRLRIFPDGGVARLRVHGTPVPDPQWLGDIPFDLAALANGGTVVECSDWFFSPPNNMLQPGESLVMSDGWETARRRDDGHDWAVIRLAAQATPRVLEIDTTHYKGNAPGSVEVSAGDGEATWRPLLARTDLRPDTSHRFRVSTDEPATHLRLDIYPDGGIARFRAYGRPTETGMAGLVANWHAATR
ncbi:MAG TPA: allantoicase [Pseudonocardiaceae bacterium]|jgi:allantoicase|nr:allantoicase [Pseudonocardiaceae bacterium]